MKALLHLVFLAGPVVYAGLPQFDHIVVVMEENHSKTQIIGNRIDAPFINSLADRGISLTNMAGVTHPSQPNYLELFSGSANGVNHDRIPGALPFTAPNLAAALLAAGKSFVGYSENLPAPGDAATELTTGLFNGESRILYARKHAPWTNWQSSADPRPTNTLPPAINQPFSAFPSDFTLLPDVAFVVPNEEHDMHTSHDAVRRGDRWLQARLGAYAAWAEAHNSLLIVTWDEDDYRSANRIPTVLVGANLQPGVNSGAWTLHHLLRLLTELSGITAMGRAQNVGPITGIFSGESPVATRGFRAGYAYRGAHDTFLREESPNASFGTSAFGGVGGAPNQQTLIRFDNPFGATPGQLPPGVDIVSAQLRVTTGPGSGDGTASVPARVALHRMLIAWDENATWNSFIGGVDADDTEAARIQEFSVAPLLPNDTVRFDVTNTVAAISGGAIDYGWLLRLDSPDAWRVILSENQTQPASRPILEITYRASAISFRDSIVKIAENAGSVTLVVRRIGNAATAASCDFTTIDGTARAGLDYTATHGTLTWPAGDTSDRTIQVPILTDTKDEPSQTFTVKLRAPAGNATLGDAPKTIVVIKPPR